MNNILIILFGNSFRNQSSGNFSVDTENDCFNKQKLASLSHKRLFNFIRSKFNLNVSIIINSYKNIYSDKLLDFYNSFNIIKYNLNENQLASEYELINQTIDLLNDINLSDYKYIYIQRIDFFIKKYFLEIFKMDENKIIYGHVDSNPNTYGIFNIDYYPLICHNITLIPKKYYNFIFERKAWYHHSSANSMVSSTSKDIIDLFIYSLHWCSSDIEWNPIYSMVGREEKLIYNQCNIIQKDIDQNSIIVASKGLYFDIINLNKYIIENDNNYDNVIFSDTINENLELIKNNIDFI